VKWLAVPVVVMRLPWFQVSYSVSYSYSIRPYLLSFESASALPGIKQEFHDRLVPAPVSLPNLPRPNPISTACSRQILCEAMRLLLRSDTGEFSLTKDLVGDDIIPPYAIFSHTWTEGEEVVFEELMNGAGKGKSGYDKIQFCGERARSDGLQYIWVDTCCTIQSHH